MYHLVTPGFVYLIVTRRTHRAGIWIIQPDSASTDPRAKVDQHVRHFNPITLNRTRFLSMVRIFSGRHEWRVLPRDATLKRFDTSVITAILSANRDPVTTTA